MCLCIKLHPQLLVSHLQRAKRLQNKTREQTRARRVIQPGKLLSHGQGGQNSPKEQHLREKGHAGWFSFSSQSAKLNPKNKPHKQVKANIFQSPICLNKLQTLQLSKWLPWWWVMPGYGKSTSQGAAAHPGTRSEEPPKGGHGTEVRKKHLNQWKIQLWQ